jgi:hypothetical protein
MYGTRGILSFMEQHGKYRSRSLLPGFRGEDGKAFTFPGRKTLEHLGQVFDNRRADSHHKAALGRVETSYIPTPIVVLQLELFLNATAV